jgi:hypothetical protein
LIADPFRARRTRRSVPEASNRAKPPLTYGTSSLTPAQFCNLRRHERSTNHSSTRRVYAGNRSTPTPVSTPCTKARRSNETKRTRSQIQRARPESSARRRQPPFPFSDATATTPYARRLSPTLAQRQGATCRPATGRAACVFLTLYMFTQTSKAAVAGRPGSSLRLYELPRHAPAGKRAYVFFQPPSLSNLFPLSSRRTHRRSRRRSEATLLLRILTVVQYVSMELDYVRRHSFGRTTFGRYVEKKREKRYSIRS